jgi:hypothetical protein
LETLSRCGVSPTRATQASATLAQVVAQFQQKSFLGNWWPRKMIDFDLRQVGARMKEKD